MPRIGVEAKGPLNFTLPGGVHVLMKGQPGAVRPMSTWKWGWMGTPEVHINPKDRAHFRTSPRFLCPQNPRLSSPSSAPVNVQA